MGRKRYGSSADKIRFKKRDKKKQGNGYRFILKPSEKSKYPFGRKPQREEDFKCYEYDSTKIMSSRFIERMALAGFIKYVEFNVND